MQIGFLFWCSCRLERVKKTDPHAYEKAMASLPPLWPKDSRKARFADAVCMPLVRLILLVRKLRGTDPYGRRRNRGEPRPVWTIRDAIQSARADTGN